MPTKTTEHESRLEYHKHIIHTHTHTHTRARTLHPLDYSTRLTNRTVLYLHKWQSIHCRPYYLHCTCNIVIIFFYHTACGTRHTFDHLHRSKLSRKTPLFFFSFFHLQGPKFTKSHFCVLHRSKLSQTFVSHLQGSSFSNTVNWLGSSVCVPQKQ